MRGDRLDLAGMRFVCSYRGAADYWYKGRKYIVRSFASDDGHYNGTTYQTDILPMVGCVRADESKYWHEFPPQEVLDLFPESVGFRYTADYKPEYNGEPPQTVTTERGETFAKHWHDLCYPKTA